MPPLPIMEGPLTELRNQRLPRRKMAQTYGKKKASGMPTGHRDLFGGENDEKKGEIGGRADIAEIEEGLARSSLGSSELATSQSKTVSKSTRDPSRREAIERARVVKESLVSDEDAAVVQPLLDLCGGKIVSFSKLSNTLNKTFEIEKIGEGSFAEVYQLRAKIGSDSTATGRESGPGGAIIKIVPLEIPSSDPRTAQRLSPVDCVAREIKVLQALDSVHGFTRFRGMRLVTGAWPVAFMSAFRTYRRRHPSLALNGSPAEDFNDRQVYAVLEMENAGTEIALIKRPSVFQVWDIFWTTAMVLANAEEQIELEHRDLHMSNVCVKPRVVPTPTTTTTTINPSSVIDINISTSSSTDAEESKPQLDIPRTVLADMTDETVPKVRLGLTNLKITIIDYTVTRCQLVPGSDEEIAYDPMAFIADLVPGGGSGFEDSLQYITYRKAKAAARYTMQMRASSDDTVSPATATTTSKLEATSASPPNRNDDEENNHLMRQFTPLTNPIWLSYLLKSLSRRSHGPARRFYVLRSSSRPARRLQESMWNVLAEVDDVISGLDPDNEDSGEEEERGDEGDGEGSEEEKEFPDEELARIPGSARELIALAIEKGWLTGQEVEVLRERLAEEE